MPGLYRVSGAAFGNTWRRNRAPRFLRGKLGAQISDCPIFTVPKTTLDVRIWSFSAIPRFCSVNRPITFYSRTLLLRRRLTQCPLKENLIRTDRPDVTNSSLKAAAPALRYLATPSSLFVDLLPDLPHPHDIDPHSRMALRCGGSLIPGQSCRRRPSAPFAELVFVKGRLAALRE